MKNIKKQFPLFSKEKDLIYLDSASTSQKPQVVIDRMNEYYEHENANVHRGIYDLSEKATAAYEGVREKVAKFINAPSKDEIIFTYGTTESINTVAFGLKDVDEVVLTEMEHHANIVPWQQVSKNVSYIPITKEGRLEISTLEDLVTENTNIVAITYISNVLGTINPVKDIIKEVKKINPTCLVLVDVAQAAGHVPIDVQALECDFFVFSSHKMYGPMGVGVLWGRKELLEKLDPFIYGGSMISTVAKEKSEWAEVPYKFEAGTPDVGGVVGLGSAIDFIESVGLKAIQSHEQGLTKYTLQKLQQQKEITLYGPKSTKERVGIFSFTIGDIHAHDVAEVLNEHQVAVRAGHHCAMPLHEVLEIPASVRVSLGIYNSKEDIDRLVEALSAVEEVFKK